MKHLKHIPNWVPTPCHDAILEPHYHHYDTISCPPPMTHNKARGQLNCILIRSILSRWLLRQKSEVQCIDQRKKLECVNILDWQLNSRLLGELLIEKHRIIFCR